MARSCGVLVIAHGSRDSAALAEFISLVDAIGRRLPGVPVRHAVLEFPGDLSPSIQAAVDALVDDGITNLVVLPMFLFDAGHVKQDIPAELAAARTRHPDLAVLTLSQVQLEDGLLDVLQANVERAMGETPITGANSPAILLVGAGTSSESANAELVRIGGLLRERMMAPSVEVAYVSLARPTVAEGVARCAELGVRRVVTVHYFLNTGVLARRIDPQARAEAERLGLELTVGHHIGAHEALGEALAARIGAALADNAAMGGDEETKHQRQ